MQEKSYSNRQFLRISSNGLKTWVHSFRSHDQFQTGQIKNAENGANKRNPHSSKNAEHQRKLSFKSEGKIKTCSDKKNLKVLRNGRNSIKENRLNIGFFADPCSREKKKRKFRYR